MNDQANYQPKADGLNPKATFNAKQKAASGQSQKGGGKSSTQEILQIAEIRDGLVIMNDGSFRVVVFCRAINFILMSQQERAAVEHAYQGFLNSLFFPIQIMVRSRRVDATHYLERLDRARQQQTNMLLELVMEDYIGFMADLIASTDIMDKFFYVVVPYSANEGIKENIVRGTQGFFGKLFKFGQAQATPLVIDEMSLNNAKRELRRRGQVIIEGLQQCGVTAVPLNTEELIELYYESYNPDESGGHQLSSLKDLTTPYITRAGETAEPGPARPATAPAGSGQANQAAVVPAEANLLPGPAAAPPPPDPYQPAAAPAAYPGMVVAPAAGTPTPPPEPPPIAGQWTQPSPAGQQPQPVGNPNPGA